MAEIKEEHVEWRVVDRLRELLEKLPDTPHDVTLTYSLFSTVICWTCQRLRDDSTGSHKTIWQKLSSERALADPWHFDVRAATEVRRATEAAVDASLLPAGRFLIGIRNAVAHGDHNRIAPHHLQVSPGRPDRRLIGFTFNADFQQTKPNGDGGRVIAKDWGGWRFDLTSMDMRRIGLSLAERFCDGLSRDSQGDAARHIKRA
jgi:hypothetical protein